MWRAIRGPREAPASQTSSIAAQIHRPTPAIRTCPTAAWGRFIGVFQPNRDESHAGSSFLARFSHVHAAVARSDPGFEVFIAENGGRAATAALVEALSAGEGSCRPESDLEHLIAPLVLCDRLFQLPRPDGSPGGRMHPGRFRRRRVCRWRCPPVGEHAHGEAVQKAGRDDITALMLRSQPAGDVSPRSSLRPETALEKTHRMVPPHW